MSAALIWVDVRRAETSQRRTDSALTIAASADPPRASRRVYPLSVIPGGIYSADELARAKRVDSVVAAHYADFGTAVTPSRLTRDLFMYVSYRRGNKVFWTANKRRIPCGEAVLSDGKNFARARCGNRLSDVARHPSVPGTQPTEAALNLPTLPPELKMPPAAPFSPAYDVAPLPPAPGGPLPAQSPAIASSAVSRSAPLAFSPGIGTFVAPYGIGPGPTTTTGTASGGRGVIPGGSPGGTLPGGGAPTPVPEPASFALFATAAALAFALRRPNCKPRRPRTRSTEK